MLETVEFKKIVGEGKALGYLDGRACFVAGPLPGETARVRVTHRTPRFVEAELVELLDQSPHRGEGAEDHAAQCSPWQAVDYSYQLELKQAMVAETMGRPELALTVPELVAASEPLGYRNKLEFALILDDSGRLELAWHVRGRIDAWVRCPEGCRLGSAAMNQAAQQVLVHLNQLELGDLATSLMVREAKVFGQCLVVVGLRKAVRRDWERLASSGLRVVVAVRQPSGRYKTLWQAGEPYLDETVGGIAVRYPYSSFFQTHVPMFEQALERITVAVPEGAQVVDLYGGCGAIGLVVAAKRRARVTGIEIDTEAVAQANASAQRAGLSGYQAVATPAERLDPALLTAAEVVIVDPPRSGLDRRVVEAIKAAAPVRILYLSCNPVTQARDLLRLSDQYQSGPVTGFDFYPGTLHVETLAVLDRI